MLRKMKNLYIFLNITCFNFHYKTVCHEVYVTNLKDTVQNWAFTFSVVTLSAQTYAEKILWEELTLTYLI